MSIASRAETRPTVQPPPTDKLITMFEARGFVRVLHGPTFHELADPGGRRVSLFVEVGLGFWSAFLYDADGGWYGAARIRFDNPTIDQILGTTEATS